MLKIYGNPMSTCTRKVLMTCAETETPHEFVLVDFAKGEHRGPAHLARQPFGQVPALEDDGFAMYESRAMARYINDKAGGKLVPSDLKQRAAMDQWISVETSNFTPHAMKFIFEHVFKRPQGAEALEGAAKSLETALGAMDKRLAESPYLAGDAITLADIGYMPYVDYAMNTPAKAIFEKFPNVMAWWKRVSERPTWRKATSPS